MSKTEHLDGNDEIRLLKEKRQKLVERIEDRCIIQEEMMYSLEKLVPNLVSSLDLSMKVISAFRGGDGNRRVRPQKRSHVASDILGRDDFGMKEAETGEDVNADVSFVAEEVEVRAHENEIEAEGSSRGVVVSQSKALSIVKSMVAGVLLSRVPWGPIDSAAILRKLENSPCTNEERSSLVELGGELGAIAAVETSMKSLSDENAGVELEDYELSGKNRIMVLSVDQNRLSKAIPDAARQTPNKPANASGASSSAGADLGRSPVVSRQEMWNGPGEVHPHGMPGGPPPMFHGAMGPRGGGPRPMGMMGGIHGQGMGYGALPPMQRQPPGPNSAPNMSSKPRTEEDDMKDIEALLKKKSFKEMQKSKTGEELFELIHRPTARETALAAKFKTKGGTQLKEYCKALTKEDCRSQRYSNIACEKVHFRRIIAPHTDISLGDCSFLDTCRHMKTCKYVHYELDPTPDIPIQGMSPLPPPKPLRAEYCSEVELGEPQWINCDIRSFRMDILGQFGVIMADPPWDIHMELPYGTMADDEMRNLNVPALQTDGLLFLWVTGRAMELGRECLELWGYRRVEELIWVKTNQLQRIIRTGRTGHWLNHSKEHCLVGIKGNPEVNRNIDTDVIVSEVRETSRKPDEMYPMLERISPRTRKLELFARMHNTHAGWMSLGNQLSGVRLVDEGLRARFKAAYPETEVQPLSPPRSTLAPDGDAVSQGKNRVGVNDAKTTPDRVSTAGPENTVTEELSNKDAEMTS